MTRADIERRRGRRGSSGTPARESTARDSAARTDEERPRGVLVVALLVGLGGLADVATGLPLLASLFPLGVVVATLGAVKLWVAVGLPRYRARALGLAVLLHAVSAMLAVLRALIATGTGGAPGGDVLRVVVDVAIVGYLLVVADHFE